jgi:hypothetical protein
MIGKFSPGVLLALIAKAVKVRVAAAAIVPHLASLTGIDFSILRRGYTA